MYPALKLIGWAIVPLVISLPNALMMSNWDGGAIAQSSLKAEANRLRRQGEKKLQAGQYVLGTEDLEKALKFYRQIKDTKSANDIVERLYLIYYSRGSYDKLEKLGVPDSESSKPESSEPTFEDKELKQIEDGIETSRSYLSQQSYEHALASLESVDRLSIKRYRAAEAAAANGDIHKKGTHFREMISHRIPILLLISETYLQNKNADKALPYLEEAAAIATKIDGDYKNFVSTGSAYISVFDDPNLYLSRANYALGKYNLALSYARKAIEKGERAKAQDPAYGGPTYLVPTGDFGDGHGHVLAGLSLEKLGKLEQAESELRQAIQIFEAARKKSTSQANIRANLTLFNNQERAASSLQRVLLAQDKSAEALAIAEWGRSRLLVESATVPRKLTLEEKVDALVDAQYTPKSICENNDRIFPEANIPKGLEQIFITSITRRSTCDSEAVIREIKKSYLKAAQESPEVLDLLASASPTNTGISSIKPPSIEQLKQIAQSHQATIVEYSIISESTFSHNPRQNYTSWNIFPGEEQNLAIWIIQPSGKIQSRQIDLKGQNIDLKNLVRISRQAMGLDRSDIQVSFNPGKITNFSKTQTDQNLKQLYQLLINPIADLLPTQPEAQVMVVPHQQLFLVPFAALIDPQGKYLIEKHTIVTTPSIQALEVTRKKKQQQAKSRTLAVVVGNPTMPSIVHPRKGTLIQLPRLPGAQREGEKIAQLLNTQLLTGNQATKAKVLSQLSNARYIHLATHGLLDDYSGWGIPGAIALAPTNNDKGLLTSSEIQELKLNAELIVLSACDTGRGDITGDGVVGLSRALIIAGVPSIVASLWSVPDAPTTELMVEFYRNFQNRKLDKAQALRQAMLTTMKTNPNPRDWAAFTLIGEAE